MYSNAISRVRWRFFPVGKEPTRSLPRFPCRSVSSLIFKTMHKRDPLPDTVCMHLYGFGATSFRSASQEPMYSARNGNLLACGRVKLPATRTHSYDTREKVRAARARESSLDKAYQLLNLPSPLYISVRPACISPHYCLTRSMMSCQMRSSCTRLATSLAQLGPCSPMLRIAYRPFLSNCDFSQRARTNFSLSRGHRPISF